MQPNDQRKGIMMTSQETLEKMEAMCIQSCSPEMFDRWEILKSYLILIRNDVVPLGTDEGEKNG